MQCNCRKVYIANHLRTTDQKGFILRQIYIVKNSKLFCTLTIAFAKFTHKVTKYILERKMESVSQNLLRFSTKIANCCIKDITKNRKSISFISIRKKRRRPKLRKVFGPKCLASNLPFQRNIFVRLLFHQYCMQLCVARDFFVVIVAENLRLFYQLFHFSTHPKRRNRCIIK